jgi:hypothetical protein
MRMYYIVIMANRFRPNMIHIYLHPEEDRFIKNYAEKNYRTVSELFRGWLHEVMKREGYKIKEPSLPEPTRRGRK